MGWEIKYRASVEKDVSRLSGDVRTLALGAIARLAADPFPAGCKKLKGAENRFRLRIAGSYRVVYSLLKDESVILVEFVGHRKDAYRWF